jgi:hypothetical protein
MQVQEPFTAEHAGDAEKSLFGSACSARSAVKSFERIVV